MKVISINRDSKYVEDVLGLHNYCFDTDKEVTRQNFEKIFLDNETEILGIVEDGALKSSMIVNDYRMYWNDQTVRMGGIGGVTTFPEARESHLVEKMITAALKKMKSKEMVFSLLAPFSYAFYRKYGWEWGMSHFQYKIPVQDFLNFEGVGYSMQQVTFDDIEGLMHVYRACYQALNGAVNRSRQNWVYRIEMSQKSKVYAYCAKDCDGSIKAYIFYSTQDGVFKVSEMGYDSMTAKKQLLRFIYVHRAQVDTVELSLDEGDRILCLFRNQHQKIELKPGLMVRVVDVEMALQCFFSDLTAPLAFTIKVNDVYADWNNGTFSVKADCNGVSVTRFEDKTADVSCTIQVFSQILFGYLSIEEADRLELLQYEEPGIIRILNCYFKKRITGIKDSF